jgi:hypothetical protein
MFPQVNDYSQYTALLVRVQAREQAYAQVRALFGQKMIKRVD